MTTPEEFKSKTTESLEYLDSILPEGSGVVVTGLAQGARDTNQSDFQY